ncbi:MAG TPA: phosphatase PAP2 family protein [Candidatus Acidoferrum sp.]|nr:phosphatase PAP2 family protein [Candidatus Acidoferrum sp.]
MKGVNEYCDASRAPGAPKDARQRSNVTLTARERVLAENHPAIAPAFAHGMREWLRRERAAAWAACGMFERVALAYLGLSSGMIAVFAENLAHPLRLAATQALVALLILALCRSEARAVDRTKFGAEAGNRADAKSRPNFPERCWHFGRHWYPHLFFLFCFEELGRLVHLVQPGWQDAKLMAFDRWLTGVQPTVWLEQFATPGRNDLMQFVYITYFTYLLIVGGVLYYRRDWRGYWSVMTYSAVAYAIGYFIAICFPIESPWFAMVGSWHGELRGGAATALINFIEHYGRVRGAAFPSEHVAGAVAATWGAWRHRRWLFWVMLPVVLCMCVSTVWGRYHYVADVFGGVITGTVGYVIGGWLMAKRNSVATISSTVRSPETLLERPPCPGLQGHDALQSL